MRKLGYHKEINLRTRSIPNDVSQNDSKNKRDKGRDEKITNKSVHLKFSDIKNIDIQIAKRRLYFVERIIRMSNDKVMTRLISAWKRARR